MIRLTLIRHAKSSWRLEGLDDASRPLNRRGLSDCLSMPAQIASRLPPPDALIASTAARAMQTAAAVADGWLVNARAMHVEPELYLAEARELMSICADAKWRDSQHLALVGHNPGMTDLYNLLSSTPIDNVPTFGVAHFELDAAWADLAPGARPGFAPAERARLAEYFTPRSG